MTTTIPSDLQIRLRTDPDLPSLPGAVQRLLALWQRADDPEPGDVASALGLDPALAAKVIAYANSAAFAPRTPIRTLRDAVGHLGTQRTRSIALTFALMPWRNGRAAACRAFWRRAVLASILARELAALQRWQGVSKEEGSLVALLQDLGALALLVVLRSRYERLVASAQEDHARLGELEERELGTDHAEVGRWILHEWRFPESIVDAVAATHSAGEAPHGPGSLAELAAVSGAIADMWPDAPSEATGNEPAANDNDPLRAALDRAAQQAVEVSDLLDARVGTPSRRRLVSVAQRVFADVQRPPV